MDKPANNLRSLPSIDILVRSPLLKPALDKYGRDLAVFAAREVLSSLRENAGKNPTLPSADEIPLKIASLMESVATCGLKKVINATGVVLHTNMGRAPLGEAVALETISAVSGYCNIEFNLASGKRGDRNKHVTSLLRYLTGAQDALVVNNNAAALILVLSTLARRREVIISRGELIEIGGEFRIPDIMRAGQARMVEVGTTNRTRLSDYENAINPQTALIFKAHKSNYEIRGFTEDAGVKELAALAARHKIPMVFDIGSGLLRKPYGLPLENEPDVLGAITDGADLVTFSGDKLLGGPQAGIIAGRMDLVARLAKAPLMRALRTGKLTIAALAVACRQYLSDKTLIANNPAFAMMSQSESTVIARAERLKVMLDKNNISCEMVSSEAQVGGGSLPDVVLKSHSVALVPPPGTSKSRERFAERILKILMLHDTPVVAVLREGRLELDCFTLADDEVEIVAAAVADIIKGGLAENRRSH